MMSPIRYKSVYSWWVDVCNQKIIWSERGWNFDVKVISSHGCCKKQARRLGEGGIPVWINFQRELPSWLC